MPDPNLDAPRPLRDRIKKFGGVNPHGQPNWRVVLAQHCTQICGGIFHNMPDGELSIVEEGKDGKLYHKELNAESVEHSFFMETPKYPHEGWILEVWMAPHLWGTREWWEAQKAEDGITPLMGPYPERGDYWMLAGPWNYAPEISDVENAILQYRRTQMNRPANLALYMAQKLKESQERKVAMREARRQEIEDMINRELLPVLRSPSLAAQRVRNDLNRQLGIGSHAAAGDF